MGLRTAEEFLAGLRDGREVCTTRGERVPDVVDQP
jgi:aromatic ring hydroxylase